MEKQDTKKLMRILQVAYPSTYRNMPDAEKIDTMSLYYDMFKEYDGEVVATALKTYVKTNQYPPTIAGLQKAIDLLLTTASGKNKDINYLWGEFKRAVRNYNGSNGQELFDSLPKEVQGFVINPAGIKDYGMEAPETINTVVRGQFNKTVTSRIQRDKDVAKLPANVVGMIAQKMDAKKLLGN